MRRKFLSWLPLLVAISSKTVMAASPDTSGNLWRVVQLCTVNKTSLGLPFPCLEVNLDAGYAVLRPPFGKADTILTPTTPSSGVEDPALAAPGAINYFNLAWKSRALIADKTASKLAPDEIGLAINASRTRSQNQMHIHIECLAADIRQVLRAAEPSIAATGWTKLKRPLRQLDFWARRIEAETLEGSNPFAIVARELPLARGNMANMTIVVAGSRFRQGTRGFLVLAADTSVRHGHTGEDLLDHACRP